MPHMAVDPRGVVPVNRVQPTANDPMETQRLMERRLGSMPPSSFAGSGAAFVPSERPLISPRSYPQGMANVMAGATLNPADIKTDRPMGLLGTAY